MRTFTEVVQSGSFAMAAERLGVSPSVVSKQIAAVEKRLGARLLNRTTRSMAVTDIGEAYYESCRNILAQVEKMEEDVATLQGTATGRIMVRVPHSIGILHLGKVITEFNKRYPSVSVSIVTDEFPLNSFEMLDRRSDVALHLGPVMSPAIATRELTQIVWLPFASPSYLKRFPAPIVPADLRKHNCLIHQAVFPDGRWRFRSAAGETFVNVRGTLSANSALILREAAENGLGIALLPSFVVTSSTRDTLVRVLPEYEGPGRHLYVAYEATRMLPKRTRLFIDYMVEHMKTPPWPLPKVALRPDAESASDGLSNSRSRADASDMLCREQA
jgi:DNA-binding transcriptional LysR family regulator